jgi:hypothetical protein
VNLRKRVILSPKAFGRSELRAYASGRSAFGLTVSIPPDFRPHRRSRIPGSSVRPIQRKTLAISRIHLQRHCLSETRSSFAVRLYLRLSDVRVDDRSFRWTCWRLSARGAERSTVKTHFAPNLCMSERTDLQ